MTASIYQQSIDKQRIIITGKHSGLIADLARHVLTSNARKFDWYTSKQPAPPQNDAPVILIEAQDQLAEYHPHILILSAVESNRLAGIEKAADAVPKGGIIIYPEADRELKAIAARERTDVQVIPYGTYKHEQKNGSTILVTSTNEKFPVALHTETELGCISAARELLKKIGISSGQFYRAVSTFRP
ncbi:MAG: hypothetical protein KIT62_09585 [Cyclobacteriaceae bacterium]|nr:hypothetical protein [Cyclobacteriaceae bacterium]